MVELESLVKRVHLVNKVFLVKTVQWATLVSRVSRVDVVCLAMPAKRVIPVKMEPLESTAFADDRESEVRMIII